MREVWGLAVLVVVATMARADDTGPKDVAAARGARTPKNEVVTFPRRLPDGRVTYIRRVQDGTLQRVIYDRVKNTKGPGDTIRLTTFGATEADVAAEPKSSEPMKNANKQRLQLLEELMRPRALAERPFS